MPKGGWRPGSGRKPGSANKKTREIADRAAAEGVTPLEYMLGILRSEPPAEASPAQLMAWEAMRFEAAKHAAPYMHPRLTSVDATSRVSSTMQVKIVSEFEDLA